MHVIDETPANWLVQDGNGTTELVGKSEMNRLLIDHDMWGLLKNGTEILTINETDDHPQVRLIPDNEAKDYTLEVGDFEGLHFGPHLKSKLVRALRVGKENDRVAEELIDLFDRTRENRVRSDVIEAIGSKLGNDVQETSDGWLFNDHLLLTWEGEFRHPHQNSFKRNGSIIEGDARQDAYDLDVSDPGDTERKITLSGTTYRLTDAEMDFLAKTLWAVANAPREVTQ